MKVCGRCKIEKNDEHFYKRINGSLWMYCHECKREYDREYYKKTQGRRTHNKRRTLQTFRLRNRQFVWDYLKAHPCSCGENNPILLDFDHRENKEYNVSEMTSGRSLESIQKEIDKCDVRCVKCHRLKTAEQLGWYKDIIR